MKVTRGTPEDFLNGVRPCHKTGPKPGGRRSNILTSGHARALITAMRDEGQTLQAIANVFGVSRVAIFKALRREQVVKI